MGRIDGDMNRWNERQTEEGIKNSWKAIERGAGGGSTWMIVSFVQASSMANCEIAQISSFHVLCF